MVFPFSIRVAGGDFCFIELVFKTYAECPRGSGYSWDD
jgi:hypothetical protein